MNWTHLLLGLGSATSVGGDALERGFEMKRPSKNVSKA